MSNLFKRLIELLPQSPLQVGQVTASSAGVVTVALPGGGSVQAIGVANVGTRVFIRAGAVEGEAPTLPVEVIQI